MRKIHPTVLVLSMFIVFTNCSDESEVQTKEATRISPYDAIEANEERGRDVSDQVTMAKSKFEQVELKDERKTTPEIDSLLNIVERAVAQNNVDLLLTTMDTSIISSYGGGMYGYEDFKLVWQDDDYQKLWHKLDKILKLGGTLENDSLYCIPYEGRVYEEATNVDEYTVPYAYGISTQADTKLYPHIDSNEDEAIAIGRTYCIIQPQDDHYSTLQNFWKVNVMGTELYGYVKEHDFYVSADYSLVIEKNAEGDWKITAFAPWD